MYKTFVRPLLFRIEPERAHEITFWFLKHLFRISFFKNLASSLYHVSHPLLKTTVFGMEFPNPVGLAAGFDKDARYLHELEPFGFGFIEIGTVTPMPQSGNEKPRMFRLPSDRGLINRMGFNNGGAEPAARRIRSKPENLIVGGNIGKNKSTPNESAIDDYIKCFNALYNEVDYFVVNVSSPNTPGLRELQEKEPLTKLLNTLMDLNRTKPKLKPVLLKIAPDLTDPQLDDIVQITYDSGIAGIIATNTTISREGLVSQDYLVKETGGLSGGPVKHRSTEVVRYLTNKFRGRVPVIAVGGIFTAQDAIEKLEAGASLVQVYTGFIYEGPAMVSNINKKLKTYYESKKSEAV